jgi:hypothetical protein
MQRRFYDVVVCEFHSRDQAALSFFCGEKVRKTLDQMEISESLSQGERETDNESISCARANSTTILSTFALVVLKNMRRNTVDAHVDNLPVGLVIRWNPRPLAGTLLEGIRALCTTPDDHKASCTFFEKPVRQTLHCLRLLRLFLGHTKESRRFDVIRAKYLYPRQCVA